MSNLKSSELTSEGFFGQAIGLLGQRGGGLQGDISRRRGLLNQEDEQQKALARQREIALLRRSFGTPGGGIATSQTTLLGG